MRLSTTLFVGWMLTGLPTLVWAQQCPEPASAAENRQNASEAFAEAQRRVEAGDYRAALHLFQCSNSLYPHHVILFHVARNHERLGELRQAALIYQEYLERYPQEVEGSAEVRGRLNDIEAEITPTPRPLPAPLSVESDTVEASERVTAETPLQTEETARVSQLNTSRIWAWISVGVGVALSGTGAGLLGAAFSLRGEYETSAEQVFTNAEEMAREQSRIDDLEQRCRSLLISGWVLTGFGLATLAASVVLFLVRPSAEDSAASDSSSAFHLALGPSGLSWSLTF